MNNIAIIPARGGSKRIKEKNIYPLLGKPMIHYIINSAISSECFSRIFVATDSSKIADIAIQCGAEVPFLRTSANDDFSPVSLATLDYTEKLLDLGIIKKPDIIAQLFAACPLTTAADISKSMDFFIINNREFQISCCEAMTGNTWWAFTLDKKNEAQWLFEKHRSMRSQDLKKTYFPTGAIWISRWENFRKEKTFYGSTVQYQKVSKECGIDIDWPEDIEMAEIFLRARGSHKISS